SLIRASERSTPMMLAPNSRASSAAVSPLPQPTSNTRRFFSSPPSDRSCLVRSVPPGRRDLYSLEYSIFLPLSHSHAFLGLRFLTSSILPAKYSWECSLITLHSHTPCNPST